MNEAKAKTIGFFAVALAASCAFAAPQAKESSSPVPQNVPGLMTAFDGRKISTADEWENVRRPEILKCFEEQCFGVRPEAVRDGKRVSYKIRETNDVLGGKAVREVVDATYSGPCGDYVFTFVSMRPKAKKPVPVFLNFFLEKGDLAALTAAPDYSDPRWPFADIIARGFATVAISKMAIAPDDSATCFKKSIFPCVEPLSARTKSSWAAISSWAWGNSRVMDWIESRPDVFDAKHVAVVGHSRGGKTALWTGATDTRFAMVCSVQSGCGGAKLNHVKLPKSEHIGQITKGFTHWFCKNYLKWRGKEFEMPFDQHMLAALVAPRLLVISSASLDSWAGQPGEWWTAKLAGPAWELYGKRGLEADAYPPVDTPQFGGSVGYFVRTGKHSITPYEWARYMDFAEMNGWKGER